MRRDITGSGAVAVLTSAISALVLATGLLASSAEASTQFVDLGSYGYLATAINNHGDIVGNTNNHGYQEAYLLKAGGGGAFTESYLESLAPLPIEGSCSCRGPYSSAWDVNDSDVVAGSSSNGLEGRYYGGEDAVTWEPYATKSPSNAAIDRGAFNYGSGDCNFVSSTEACSARANAINNAGEIAGEGEYYNESHGWAHFPFALASSKEKLSTNPGDTENGTVDMLYFNATLFGEFEAWGLNASGQTVVSPDPAEPSNNDSSAIYPGDHPVPFESNVHAGAYHPINDSGWVVGYDSASKHAKLMEGVGGTVVELPPLAGGTRSEAGAINNTGDVVGSSTAVSGCPSAVLWRHGQYNSPVDLNTQLPLGSTWHLYGANAINDGGQIVGQGLGSGSCEGGILEPYELGVGTGLSIAGTTVAEPKSGVATANFPVTLGQSSTSPVTVQYTTQDGTGAEGAVASKGDYEATQGTLTFNPGDTAKTIPVTIKPNGITANRTFAVVLSGAKGASIVVGEATGTIAPSTVMVSGVVGDTYHKPVVGAVVKLTGTSDELSEISRTEVTNGDGKYSFDLPPGSYAVTTAGEPPEQNGGKMTISQGPGTVSIGKAPPVSPPSPQCTGTAKENICTLSHLSLGEEGTSSFTYTYCAASELNPNGKPATGCPIIFIPGFLGSRIVCNTGELWPHLPMGAGTALRKAEFGTMLLEPDGVTNAGAPGSCSQTSGPVPGQAGVVGLAAGEDIYQSVLDYMNHIVAHGYVTSEEGAYAFPYDWRKSPLIAAEALDPYVNEVRTKTGAARVVLMAHSMGGLVLQAYLADEGHSKKVARAITLGTPYWGAPKSHTALLTAKSNTPKPELIGLDLFINAPDLQNAARNMQGLYWLYPDANFGPWLKVNLSGGTAYGLTVTPGKSGLKLGQWLSSSEIGPWVAALGGASQLESNAFAGHAALDGFKTNGVPYQIVVGVGVPTITRMEVSENAFEGAQFVQVTYGSGDGTVPAVSATQGVSEGKAPLRDSVPIDYECKVDHVALPGNKGIQTKIEGYLLKGDAVTSGAICPYSGIETELFKLPPKGTAFNATVRESEKVLTAKGSLTLEQAVQQRLIQVISSGSRTIVVTDNSNPVTLQITGKGLAVKVRSIKSAPKGTAGASGPSRYYGPVNGTVKISKSGAVTRNGKRVKAGHRRRPPRTVAHVRRHGRYYLLRLTASDSIGVAGTFVRIGKASSKRYKKPLKLTKTQLKNLRFSSVDTFGTWERPEKAKVPRH